MKRMVIPTLMLATLTMGLEVTTPKIALAESLANTANSDRRVAQMFFPSVNNRRAIMVLGQGQVSIPAETASVQFTFNSNNPFEPPSLPSLPSLTQQSEENTPSEVQPTVEMLTKERLKPIVDALIAIGVPANAIEVSSSSSSSASSFPFPFPATKGGVKVLVKADNPTRDRIQQIVNTVNEAASKNGKLVVGSVSVRYAMKDCQTLVRAAYQAAVKDARNRAEAIAQAIGVRLGIPSVSESFIYDLFVPLCSETSELPSFLPFGNNTTPYDPNASTEVRLRRDIFVTYPIK
ncbi:SIMPL domain-containing protein [Argonema antarcticum]|uniref:SIMPL domain-containing protein n=1 Tax=Argonema antarcticum TaxID=2942763 RepID=UPI002011B917|nr:SIMPL domain-containing protein [Argonema antarcticum]MCL1470810.1 SIMPL domain-containing protein [Argonema antarcticum A004/B2]